MTHAIQLIPLHQLSPSAANVRKTGGSSIDELAASIAAHGLLQNLQVRPNGKKGRYEVIAGGRRLKALQQLRKSGTLPKDFPVPCQVLTREQNSAEISLAENVIREAMHPADQFEAFQALAGQGMGPADIAGRFGTSEERVRKLLKLACVSSILLDAYRAEALSLEQLMAFTLSDDHARQLQVWDPQQGGRCHFSAHGIRRALTETQVADDDPRARYVGEEAYLAAGGTITRDLFEEERYFADAALLDRLVHERMCAAAAPLKSDGWKWAYPAHLLDAEARRGFDLLQPEQRLLSPEQQLRLADLEEEIDPLVAKHGEVPDDPEVAERLIVLYAEHEALEAQRFQYRPEDKARSGVLLELTRDGGLTFSCGWVRPEDRGSHEGPADKGAPCHTTPKPRISGKLVAELRAHQTAALRAVLAEHAHELALDLLLHRLASQLFCRPGKHPLRIAIEREDLARHGETVKASQAQTIMEEAEAGWAAKLPDTAESLMDAIASLTLPDKLALLAFCIACGLDGVHYDASALAECASLQMQDWWQPDAERYLSRVSAKEILAAVEEARGPEVRAQITGLKKRDLVRLAEQHLAGSGWLPPELRLAREPVAEGDGTSLQQAA